MSITLDDAVCSKRMQRLVDYVPRATIQKLNKDGSIKETITLGDNGVPTVVKGGIPSVPPGAPEDFVKANTANSQLFTKTAQESDAKVLISNRYDLSPSAANFQRSRAEPTNSDMTKIDAPAGSENEALK